jgi:putative tributyrin esterase
MAPSKRGFLVLIAGAAVVLLVGWRFISRSKPPAPVANHPRLAPGVIMRDVTFRSQALQRDMQYRVFLSENPGKQKLAVVYLLHGGGGNFRDWSNYSNVAQYAANDLMLVMPQGNYSYYTNFALRPQERYEDYVVDDLSAEVETRFPARTDRGGRAIVGVSMGGFGAVKLALRHPEKYAFVGALSAAIDVPRRPFSWRRLNQSRGHREMFGPDGSESRHKNDPFLLVRAADSGTVPFFYMTCGRQEGLLAPNREFATLLTKYNIRHEFHEVPGGHDWNQWNAQLPALFESLRSAPTAPKAALSPVLSTEARR